MFKTILTPAILAASLAVPASAQNTIRDIAFQSGMYQQQVIGTWAAYQAITGIDPSPMNPNSWYVPSGGGVMNVGYLNELDRLRGIPSGAVIVEPAPYGGGGYPVGGGGFPGGGGGYNNTGWGVGVNAGVGGGFGGGNGGGRNYDYNNTNWGIGINGGVGGNSGSWGGGGFNNLGWGVGINGGIGGNSGSFRSW